MKRKLALLPAMAMTALLIFTGCGPNEPGASGSPGQSSDPGPAGTTPGQTQTARTNLNSQLFADPTTLDPQMVTSSYDGSVVMQIYDSLFEVADGNYENLQNSLCESHESNDEATEWTFHIRRNVPFHNGDILTGEDVAFTIERLRISPVTAVTYSCISGVELVDEYTVKVTCSYPVFRLPTMLSGYPSGIVNKKLIEQYGDSAEETIVGTGAYQLVEWTPGYGVTLKAFNEGWRGAPAIQDIQYTVILDTNAARIAFQNEEIDAFYATSQSDLDLLTSDDRFHNTPYTIGTEDHLVFNTTRAWCDNVTFRQAVAHAIDRQALSQVCSDGLWAVAESIVAPGNIAYRENLQFPYQYDPDRARDLLAECGYDGSEVGLLYTSSYPVPNTWGTTVEGYLRAVGINVRMDGFDYSNVVSRVVSRDYDMCLFEYAVSYADPLSSYYAMYRSDGYYNVWQVFSEEMDARILSMYAMNDEQLAKETQDIDAWAQEQCLYVPCYQQGGYVFQPFHIRSTSVPEPMFGHIRVCYSKWLTDEELAQLEADQAGNEAGGN